MNNQRRNTTEEIDLLELFFVLKKKLAVIIAAALAGAVLFGAYTMIFVTPLYSASARMYVLGANTTIESITDIQLGSQLKGDYAIMIKGYSILNDVIDNLGLDMTYEQLNNIVKVENLNDSRVLAVTVTHPVPETAANIANEVANVSSLKISEIMDTVQPNVYEPARIPKAPVSPNLSKNILMGALIGLVLACAVIIVIHLLDDRIKTEEDVEKYLGLTVLGTIPDKGKNRKKSEKSNNKKSGGDKQ